MPPDPRGPGLATLAQLPPPPPPPKPSFSGRPDSLRAPCARDWPIRSQWPGMLSGGLASGGLAVACDSRRVQAGAAAARPERGSGAKSPKVASKSSAPYAAPSFKGRGRGGKGEDGSQDGSPKIDRRSPYSINVALVGAGSVFEVLDLVDKYGDCFNDVNAATAFHRVAKLTPLSNRGAVLMDPRLEVAVSAVDKWLPTFSGRCLATVAWGHARLRHGGPGFMRKVASRMLGVLDEKPDSLSETDWSNLFWAYGKAGLTPEGFGEKMLPSLLPKLKTFSLRSLVHIVWTCATLDHSDDKLFLEISDQALRPGRLAKAAIQSISNMLWSFAKMGCFPDALFAKVLENVSQRGSDMNVVDLAHVFWSVARYVTHKVESTVDLVTAEDQDSEYAFVIQKCGLEEIVVQLSYMAMEMAHQLGTQELPSIFWAVGTLRRNDTLLLGTLATRAIEMNQSMKPWSIAVVCWGVASVRYCDPSLMDCLAARGIECLKNPGLRRLFFPQTTAMICYGFGSLNHASSAVSRKFLVMLGDRALESVEDLSNQALATISWSLAAAGCLHCELFDKLQTEMSARASKHGDLRKLLTRPELTMLHQVTVALRQEAPFLYCHLPETTNASELFTLLYDAGRTITRTEQHWLERVTHEVKRQTSFHTEVADTVKALGLEFELEHLDHYSIDIALVKHKVAIEVDGPSHFVLNTLQPMGATILKWRGLSGLGWRVVSVPFFKWDKLGTLELRQAYMKNLLEKSGVVFGEGTVGASNCAQDMVSAADGSEGSQGDLEVEGSGAMPGEVEDGGSLCKPSTGTQEGAEDPEQQEGSVKDVAQKLDIMEYGRGSISKHQLLVNAAARKVKEKS
eukprot:evm.model.scf_85EXC.8 EVM.evm.TU.scf_85EXC.8   scf_85EXC:58931-61486(+)